MKMIEISYDKQATLKEGVKAACDAVMELKEIVSEICEEDHMERREGDEWYIRQGREGGMGMRRGGRMGRRGSYPSQGGHPTYRPEHGGDWDDQY